MRETLAGTGVLVRLGLRRDRGLLARGRLRFALMASPSAAARGGSRGAGRGAGGSERRRKDKEGAVVVRGRVGDPVISDGVPGSGRRVVGAHVAMMNDRAARDVRRERLDRRTTPPLHRPAAQTRTRTQREVRRIEAERFWSTEPARHAGRPHRPAPRHPLARHRPRPPTRPPTHPMPAPARRSPRSSRPLARSLPVPSDPVPRAPRPVAGAGRRGHSRLGLGQRGRSG